LLAKKALMPSIALTQLQQLAVTCGARGSTLAREAGRGGSVGDGHVRRARVNAGAGFDSGVNSGIMAWLE